MAAGARALVSTQGTGSISVFSYERELLTCWGDWARSGHFGMGYAQVQLMKKGGDGFMFSEADLVQADQVIAGLPPHHKRVLKVTFLHGKGHKIDEQQRSESIGAFSESLSGYGEEP